MEGRARIAGIAEHTWFDNRSWEPKSTPAPELPDLPSPSVAEVQPGSLDYLRLGCDELYTELGGES